VTWNEDDQADVHRLNADELAAALLAGAEGSDWSEQAAVELLVGQRNWLHRAEFRQAVEAIVLDDGQLCAWVDWSAVAMDAPASSGELRILAVARSLGGVASERPLGDLLVGLDETNTARVTRAVGVACAGRDSSRGSCGPGLSC
jgi:hypothetical protein